MTIRQALILGSKKLKNKSTSANLDSEVLLTFVLKKSKEHLFSHLDSYLPAEKQRTFINLVIKRSLGHPVAYLIGSKEFFGLDFKVDKHTLVPRPETEILIEAVIDYAKNKKNLRILDIGTGSGNIIISLAKNLKAQFFASDISDKALFVAKQNAKKHKVKIKFQKSNLLKNWRTSFDIIVANLPYGWREWKNNTSVNTVSLKFEPQNALFTGKKGLELYEKLFRQISIANKPKLVAIEFDPRQAKEIKKLAAKLLPVRSFEIVRDLSHKPRVALILL